MRRLSACLVALALLIVGPLAPTSAQTFTFTWPLWTARALVWTDGTRVIEAAVAFRTQHGDGPRAWRLLLKQLHLARQAA